jgi:hypothetical protein
MLDYLGRKGMTWDDTPELDWYFPYYIDFCKQADLTAYATKGTFSPYKLMLIDFKKYYLENSGFNIIDAGSVSEKGTYDYDHKYYFKKNGDIWEYGTSADNFIFKGEFKEIKGALVPLTDNPFDPYKSPEIVVTTTDTTAITTAATSPYTTPYTTLAPPIITGTDTEQTPQKTNKIPIVIYILSVVVIVSVISLVIAKAKNKQNGGKK